MMRKLGMWCGPALAATLLVAGLAGSAARPALAQDKATPWLGVSTQSLDEGLREGLSYKGDGVLVSRVVEDSPASRAGVRKGDIVVSVNSKAVKSPRELTDVIRGGKVGQTTSIVVVRDGQRRTLSAKLAERPDDADLPDMEMDDWRDMPRHMEHDFGPMMHWYGEDHSPGTFVFRGMGRGRLGVRIEDLNADLGPYFSTPDAKGALIVEVLKDTPAEKAGLKAGDVIKQVGDRKISDSEDLTDALRDAAGDTVTIAVTRKGVRKTVKAVLEEGPRSMRFGSGSDYMVLRPRGGTRVIVPKSGESSDELKELRDEVRQLREKVNRLEDGHD